MRRFFIINIFESNKMILVNLFCKNNKLPLHVCCEFYTKSREIK